jgi:signal transduction histidine kinase
VAIENARLYEEAAQREAWLAATAEVIGQLSRADDGVDPLQTVADRAREVARADAAWIVSGRDVSELAVRVVSGPPADPERLGHVRLEHSLARHVIEKGEPTAVESLGDDPRAIDFSGWFGWPKMGPAVVVPLKDASGPQGALALAWTPDRADEYHTLDTQLPASFAEQAALALQVARSREDQQRLAVFEDRDRIGRDLHDLVIQRLFAIGLALENAARLAVRPEVTARLTTAVDDLDTTIKDIRRSIFELGSGRGSLVELRTDLGRVIDEQAVMLGFRPSLVTEGPVDSAVPPETRPHLLAVLREGLSNAARHAKATSVDVTVQVGTDVVLTVTDNGRGVEEGVRIGGIRNLTERAESLGGTCEVLRRPEGGTLLRWSVPLA